MDRPDPERPVLARRRWIDRRVKLRVVGDSGALLGIVDTAPIAADVVSVTVTLQAGGT
jgi:hypothetical protein